MESEKPLTEGERKLYNLMSKKFKEELLTYEIEFFSKKAGVASRLAAKLSMVGVYSLDNLKVYFENQNKTLVSLSCFYDVSNKGMELLEYIIEKIYPEPVKAKEKSGQELVSLCASLVSIKKMIFMAHVEQDKSQLYRRLWETVNSIDDILLKKGVTK